MRVRTPKPLPSKELVWENFEYAPLTGQLHRISRGRVCKLGTFGCLSTLGYIEGMFQRKMYKGHRLIWLWVTGEDPGTMEVDHIDRNRANNAWANLRKVQKNKQAWNTSTYSNNKLKVRGVKQQPGGKYMARIRTNGKLKYLGIFATVEEASQAYERANARRASGIETQDPGAQ